MVRFSRDSDSLASLNRNTSALYKREQVRGGVRGCVRGCESGCESV